MAQSPTITDRVLEQVRLTPECRLDDLVLHCQDFTWREVFLEVNRLNLGGRLLLTSTDLGAYTVRVVERERVTERESPASAKLPSKRARKTSDGTLGDLLASCPDLLGGNDLPELHRLNQLGRVQLIHRDADSFTIKLLRK